MPYFLFFLCNNLLNYVMWKVVIKHVVCSVRIAVKAAASRNRRAEEMWVRVPLGIITNIYSEIGCYFLFVNNGCKCPSHLALTTWPPWAGDILKKRHWWRLAMELLILGYSIISWTAHLFVVRVAFRIALCLPSGTLRSFYITYFIL